MALAPSRSGTVRRSPPEASYFRGNWNLTPIILQRIAHDSQIMVDKLATLPRTKIGEPFGRLDAERMRGIDRALLLVVGVI